MAGFSLFRRPWLARNRIIPASRCARPEEGTAAIEFALVVPLLFTLLFGMITTGLAYSDHLSATNAVREGARYGAAADISNVGWPTSVRDRVKQVYFNAGVQVTDDQICVKLVQASGITSNQYTGSNCGTAPSNPTSMAAGSCAVVVWMQRPQSIKLLFIPDLNFNIGAESVAYYGRKMAPCTAS